MGTQENKNVESNKVTKTRERGASSPLYVIKAFNQWVKKVEEAKLLPKHEMKELQELGGKMVRYFMGEPMFEKEEDK